MLCVVISFQNYDTFVLFGIRKMEKRNSNLNGVELWIVDRIFRQMLVSITEIIMEVEENDGNRYSLRVLVEKFQKNSPFSIFYNVIYSVKLSIFFFFHNTILKKFKKEENSEFALIDSLIIIYYFSNIKESYFKQGILLLIILLK